VNYVLGVLAIVGLFAVMLGCCRLCFIEGWKCGQRETDKWWIGAEDGADQARQEIWRFEKL
jgi:hypothetical protein